jgi:hypothetical protein
MLETIIIKTLSEKERRRKNISFYICTHDFSFNDFNIVLKNHLL